jgi:acetate kinase
MSGSTSMRVELIKQPRLANITKAAIEKFMMEYEVYVEKVEQQGTRVKTIVSPTCQYSLYMQK